MHFLLMLPRSPLSTEVRQMAFDLLLNSFYMGCRSVSRLSVLYMLLVRNAWKTSAKLSIAMVWCKELMAIPSNHDTTRPQKQRQSEFVTSSPTLAILTASLYLVGYLMPPTRLCFCLQICQKAKSTDITKPFVSKVALLWLGGVRSTNFGVRSF